MTKSQIQKLMTAVGFITYGMTVHTYYQSYKQPSSVDIQNGVNNVKSGIESVREVLKEQQELYINNQSLQGLHREYLNQMLGSKLESLKRVITKIQEGQSFDKNNDNDLDVQNILELEKLLKTFVNSNEFANSKDFEAIPVSQEAATQRMAETLKAFKQMKEDNSENFINNNQLLNEFTDYINNYKEWLTSLTVEQQGLMLNISATFTALLLTSSLITIFYSDWLITKFNIEQKFPSLGRFLVLRRKLQNYYFFINSLLIVVLLGSALFLNIYGLMSSLSK